MAYRPTVMSGSKPGHSTLSDGHSGDSGGGGVNKKGGLPLGTSFSLVTSLYIFCAVSILSTRLNLRTYMTLDKVGRIDRTSASSTTGPSHGRVNYSRSAKDQGDPMTHKYVNPFF